MARARSQLAGELSWSAAEFPRLHVQTLGASQIQIGAERISPTSGTLFALIVRLVYAPAMTMARESLLASLWPSQDESRRRANLRQALYKLRGIGVLMELEGDDITLDPRQVSRTFCIERTAECFERDVIQGHEPFGTFLAGFEPKGVEYLEWLGEYREIVHSDVRRILVGQLRARRERADWHGAEKMARWLLQFDPLNEEATLTMAECAALSGGKAQAVKIIDTYLSELGADAGDIRIPATTLRRRLVDNGQRRISFAPTERHFVGREEELAELTLAMRRARWHDGSAYLIYGPPGMGKTRLTQELEKVATVEGMLQLRLSCRESDITRPMSLVMELVSELLGSPGALGCAPETLKNLRRLIGEEPVALSPEGVPLAREPLPTPAAIRRGIADVIAAVSDEKPVFLVVDDVHWLDTQSWDVLVDLIERTEATRVCVLMTSRQPHACVHQPERVPVRLKVWELKGLSVEQCVSLSNRIMEDLSAEFPERLSSKFALLSEGVPFFFRSLLDSWFTSGEFEEIPPSLLALIAQRVSSLSPSSQAVLRAIGILGSRYAEIGKLLLVLEMQSFELQVAISDLEATNTIRMVQNILQPHELVTRTVLKYTGPSERALLHYRVALVLQQEIQSGSVSQNLLRDTLHHWQQSRCMEKYCEFVTAMGIQMLDAGLVEVTAEACSICETQLSPTHIFQSKLRSLRLAIDQQYGVFRTEDDFVSSLTQWERRTDWDEPDATTAILRLDRAFRSEPAVDRQRIANTAMFVMCSPDVRIGTRIDAAELTLVVASNIQDASLARRALEGIENFANNGLAKAEQLSIVRMIFHTSFGDLKIAESLALQEFEKGMSELHPLAAIRILERASFALNMCGHRELSIAALERAIANVEAGGLGARGVYPAWRLSLTMLECGDLPSALKWAERMVGWTKEGVSGFGHAVQAQLARLAIEQKDKQVAEKQMMLSRKALTHMPTLRAASYQSALELSFANTFEQEVDRTCLSVAMSRHALLVQSGTVDFQTASIAESLVRIGDVEQARTFVGNSLKVRRDLCAILPRLQDFVKQWIC